MIWTLGLNLYAARLADTGQQLRQHMHQQVRAAYPQLQVILNPLQQVRQQLAAGDNGAVAPSTTCCRPPAAPCRFWPAQSSN
ncbi:hypothetical protein NWF32_27125 [Pseudomonas qingdaonensis]|nr:hypothetical protein [Pseudomonas qingdaonensis]